MFQIVFLAPLSDRSPRKVYFGYQGVGNSIICWFMEEQDRIFEIGTVPGIQGM